MNQHNSFFRMSLFFLTLTLSTSVMATSYHGDWRSSERRHDFKHSIETCVAETTTSQGILTLAFPKDRNNFPIIKIRARSFANKNYIGAHFRMTGQPTLYAFPMGEQEKQTLYFIPSSPEQFDEFIHTLRAQSSLRMLKFFTTNEGVKAHALDASLKGSTDATNKVLKCLGSRSFLSSAQKDLLRSYNLYFNQAPVHPTPNAETFRFLGYGEQMFENLEDISSDIAPLFNYTVAKNKITNDPKFQQWKVQVPRNQKIYQTNNQIVVSLSDNLNFFQNADQQIQDLVEANANLSVDNTALSNRINVLDTAIAAADEVLVGLYAKESQANTKYQAAISNFSAQQTRVQTTASALSELEQRLQARELELKNRNAESHSLKIEMDHSANDYRNRDRIRRDIESQIYQKFGGSPQKLQNDIDTFETRKQRSTQVKDRAMNIKKLAQEIVESAKAIHTMNRSYRNANEQLNCFQGIQVGTGLANCVQKLIDEKDEAIDLAQEVIRNTRRIRCQGGNRRQCEQNKTQKIQAAQSRIAGFKNAIDQLKQRQAIIRDTGKDEQREQSIQSLVQKKNRIESQRKKKVTSTQQLIHQLPQRRNFNYPITFIFDEDGISVSLPNFPRDMRRDRPFEILENLRRCQVSAQRPCQKPAEDVVSGMKTIIDRSERTFQANQQKIAATREKLRKMNNEIEQELVGLNDRLYQAMKKAEEDYYNNLDRTDKLSDEIIPRLAGLVTSKSATLSQQSTRLEQLRSEMQNKELALQSAQSKISSYKTSVAYDKNINERRHKNLKRSNNLEQIKLNESIRLAKIERKNSIALEVETYPTRISEAQVKANQAKAYLSINEPSYLIMAEELNRLEVNISSLTAHNGKELENLYQFFNTIKIYLY